VSKKTAEAERRARVAEMRRRQESIERRRTMLIAGAAGLLVIVLVGVVAFVIRGQLQDRDITRVGVALAAAKCDKTITDKTKGASVHVGPGTDQPSITKIKYDMVPPTSGQHFVTPESPARPFYTAADRPKTETLVHNLEHGYTVLWYSTSLPAAKIDQLRKIGDLARRDPATGSSQKFIVSAWDTAYGAFPAGKTLGISHWGAKSGFRQLCGDVSGAAVQSFVDAHPSTDSPEPNGA
jgi:hypothetical protein